MSVVDFNRKVHVQPLDILGQDRSTWPQSDCEELQLKSVRIHRTKDNVKDVYLLQRELAFATYT